MSIGYKGYIFDEINKAWLAGVLDGEGCISIRKRTSKWTWRVEIANKNLEFLNKVKEITNSGSISKCSKNKVYTWEVNRKSDIHYILKYILPYLIIKREKAINCIKDIEKEKYTYLTCPKCNYSWRYFGIAKFPTCPSCQHHGTFFGMKDRNILIYNKKCKPSEKKENESEYLS